MKHTRLSSLIFVLVALLLMIGLAGCDGSVEPAPAKETATETPTPQTQATIDAALTQTVVAEEAFQSALDEALETAVAATMSAMSAVEVENPEDMSEEEMSNEIDNAVSDAEDAYQQTTAATDEATADGTLTQEELDEIEAYLSDLAYAIALAEDLIYVYDDVYGELATETLSLLMELEDDLDELAAFATDMVELLITAEEALGEGFAGAEDLITQFQEAASQVDSTALVEAKDAWIEARRAEVENRAAMLADLTPTEVAGSRRETLLSAFNYIDAARAALADGKLTLSELLNVGQLGVNAQASFGQFSGPLLQNRSSEIGDINNLLAHGQLPQAMNGVNNLEGLLGKRP